MVRDLSASSSFFGTLNQYDGIEAGSCYANCANAYYYLVDATTWTQSLLESTLAGWTSSRVFSGFLQSNYVSQLLTPLKIKVLLTNRLIFHVEGICAFLRAQC